MTAPDGKFLCSLYNELSHHCRLVTHEKARKAIIDYIEISYNPQWKQARLGYLSPAAFTQQSFKNQLPLP